MKKQKETNQKVQFVQETFGIKLPGFKLCDSSSKIPSELEMCLPQEGMNPVLAIKQLSVCSELVVSFWNGSNVYDTEIIMQTHQYALLNCMYLASRDLQTWNQIGLNYATYIDMLCNEMILFHKVFSNQKNSRFYEDYMNRTYLRLLLESNTILFKGFTTDDGEFAYNTLYTYLFPDFLVKSGSSDVQKYIKKVLNQKCNEVYNQLKKMN